MWCVILMRNSNSKWPLIISSRILIASCWKERNITLWGSNMLLYITNLENVNIWGNWDSRVRVRISSLCHWNAIHLNSWLSLYPSFIYVQVFEFVYELVTKFWIKCNQQFAPVRGPACRPLCRLGRCAARQTDCPTGSSGLQPGAAGWCADSSSFFVPVSSQHLYICDTFLASLFLMTCTLTPLLSSLYAYS